MQQNGADPTKNDICLVIQLIPFHICYGLRQVRFIAINHKPYDSHTVPHGIAREHTKINKVTFPFAV